MRRRLATRSCHLTQCLQKRPRQAETTFRTSLRRSIDPSLSPRQRLLARLQSRSAMSWVELLPCAGLLAGVALLVYGQHVRHGGFYWDDWSHASDYRDEGWQFAVNLWHDVLPGRPALAALLPVPYAVFGNDVGAHLAMAVGLGTATSFCFYIFLRALSIEPSGAFAISLLSLLFPWSEAARVWPTASINNLAVCAYLLGTVVALNGLRLEGRRAVLRHGMAALLYLLSLLIYEVAGCAIALSIVLYRTRTSLRRAATRWLFDVLLVVVVLSVSAVYTSRVRHVGSLAERITDVPQFSKQGVSIFASSFLPSAFDSMVPKGTVLVACALITGYASFLARDPSRETLRRWLGVLAVATLGLASAYVMFLGSGLYPKLCRSRYPLARVRRPRVRRPLLRSTRHRGRASAATATGSFSDPHRRHLGGRDRFWRSSARGHRPVGQGNSRPGRVPLRVEANREEACRREHDLQLRVSGRGIAWNTDLHPFLGPERRAQTHVQRSLAEGPADLSTGRHHLRQILRVCELFRSRACVAVWQNDVRRRDSPSFHRSSLAVCLQSLEDAIPARPA